MSGETPRPGMFRKVTSLANPLVKDIRALHQKKDRDAAGLFLAEGQKLVRDALDGGWPIHTLVYAAGALETAGAGDLAASAKASGGTVLEVSRAVLEKITRRDNPQAMVGVFRQRTAKAEAIGRSGVWIALDRIRDPGNLGTIIRTADAAGLTGVALVGASCDPFSVETVRATMGSIFHVPVARTDEAHIVALAGQGGINLLGTHLTRAAIDYREADYRQPLVLLMGNEQQGLSETLAAACGQIVRIPMAGRADSLNLAVSTGLMIYEALRHTLR